MFSYLIPPYPKQRARAKNLTTTYVPHGVTRILILQWIGSYSIVCFIFVRIQLISPLAAAGMYQYSKYSIIQITMRLSAH